MMSRSVRRSIKNHMMFPSRVPSRREWDLISAPANMDYHVAAVLQLAGGMLVSGWSLRVGADAMVWQACDAVL